MSELRYHPFLDQWVITATHRQDRTFHPPADYCPLCPTKPGGFPTEIPYESYDIVVFENKFPSLRPDPFAPEIEGTPVTPVRPSQGVCEVVCYSDKHDATFATLPRDQARKLTRVWRERYIDLASRPGIDYIFIFENKGKEIGVTLSHPHGQIYAYPFIPPTLAIELTAERKHFEEHGRPLMEDWLATELGGEYAQEQVRHVVEEATIREVGEFAEEHRELFPERPAEQAPRLVAENATFVAIVPFFARYPYEVWVTSKRHIRSLADMGPKELDDLADMLLTVTKKYDLLFGFSLPYIMSMHQEPAARGYEFNWFHVEFYPPYRTENKLKYLAGSEAGAGAFINDTLPEVTAKTLRELG